MLLQLVKALRTLYASDESLIPNAGKTYIEAITFGTTAPTVVDTILDIVE